MMIKLEQEIKEFSKNLILDFDSYCKIQEGRTKKSYKVNGCRLENDIVSNTATIYTNNRPGPNLIWGYYDADIDQWYLPNTEFVRKYCEFVKNSEDVHKIAEFDELIELRKILKTNNIEFK